MILNETYYGKNPILLKCEGYLQEIKTALANGRDPNTCPCIKKLETELGRLFGFEKVFYRVIADNYSGNSMTTPFYWDYSKPYKDDFWALEKTKNGIKFKNPKGKTLYVYGYNEIYRIMSTEQLMSIMLHEIGHNFFLIKEHITYAKQFALNGLCLDALQYIRENGYSRPAYAEVYLFMKDVIYITQNGFSDYYYEVMKKEFSHRKQNEQNKNYTDGIIFKTVYTTLKAIGSILSVPLTSILTLFLPIFLFLKPNSYRDYVFRKEGKFSQGYNAEKFSDNFAVSYGYGVGVVELFNNSQGSFGGVGEQFAEKIPVLRVWWYYETALMRFIACFENEHPDDIRRCQDVLEKLKYELKNNKDIEPYQRAEIEIQISKIEDIIKNRPYYKRGIDAIFDNAWKKKHELGSVGYDKEQIWDFDNKKVGVLKDHIKR